MALSTHLKKIKTLPIVHRKDFADLISEWEDAQSRNLGVGDFLEFVKMVWPAFIEGGHHRIMADAFNRIAKGDLKRLIINMPPVIQNRNSHRIFFRLGTLASFQTAR